MSTDALAQPSQVSQLGVRVRVPRVEARATPSLTRDAQDTTDFYIVEVSWDHALYGEITEAEGELGDIQNDLQGVVVTYEVAYRFSVIKKFHDEIFKVYREHDELFPSTVIECCVCGHDDLVGYRRAGFEAYLQSLASSYLAPTALVEFAMFLLLHAPPPCTLSRPSKFVKDVLDVALQKGGGDLTKAQEAKPSLEVFSIRDKGVGSMSKGFRVDDVVKVVKEGSSFWGREATVTDPNWENSGRVKVAMHGLIGQQTGAKTYKPQELELVKSSELNFHVLVGEKEVALPSGILLRRPLRRQFEYTDVIRSDPNDIEAEVLRLWEENKVLRDKNEKLLLDLARGSSMDEATIKKLVAGPEKEAEMLRRNRDRDANTIAHLRNQVTTLEQKVLELELHQEPEGTMKKSTFFGRSSKSSNGKSPNGKSPTAATSKVAPANGSRTSSPKEATKYKSGSIDATSPSSSVGSPTAAAAAAASTSNHDQTLQEAVDALNSRSTDAKVLVGLKRLINLSLNSHDHAVQFVQMGGVAGVNSVLKEYGTNTTMQEKGLKLLVNLSFASEEASQEMVQAGTIPLVLQSIERDFSATEVQIKGLWVLKNLTHYRDGCTAVVAAGGVRVAALSMATNLPMIKLVEQGLGVLQNVAHFDAADTVKEATANANLDLPRLRSMHTDNRELADNTARLEQDLKLVKAA